MEDTGMKGTRGHEQDDDTDDDDDAKSFRIKAKPKTINEILADSDEENDAVMGDNEDTFENGTHKLKKNKKKHHAYIAENGGKDIVDFLDASASQKVTSTLPKTSATDDQKEGNKKSKNGGFQIAKDGRLIIEDSDDNDDEGPWQKKLHFMDQSDESEDEGKI